MLEPYLGRWLHVRGTIMGFRWFPNPSGKGRILRMCIADPANIGELTYNPWCDYEQTRWYLSPRGLSSTLIVAA